MGGRNSRVADESTQRKLEAAQDTDTFLAAQYLEMKIEESVNNAMQNNNHTAIVNIDTSNIYDAATLSQAYRLHVVPELKAKGYRSRAVGNSINVQWDVGKF